MAAVRYIWKYGYFNETRVSYSLLFFFLYFYFSRGSVSACFATGIVCNLVNNPPVYFDTFGKRLF